MGFPLQGRQLAAVEATLQFANLPAIHPTKESASGIAQCFGGFLESHSWKQPAWFDPKGIPTDAFVDAHTQMQRVIREWLTRITQSPARKRNIIRAEIAKALPTVQLGFDGKGRLAYDHVFGNASDMLTFGVALILDEDRKLTNRLEQCWCTRFVLPLRLTGGRPPKYCPEHMKDAERKKTAKRVKKFRAKESRKARKS